LKNKGLKEWITDMNESFQHDDARFIDLLQRWSAGDFTRSDEQELYALARSDEHRREALEGFMAVPDHDHDVRIEALRQKLQEQTGSNRRILPISVIMSIAAGIVLLIIAIVSFPMLQKSAETQVAMDTAPTVAKPDAVVTQTDQSPPAVQTPAATQPSERTEAAKKMPGGPALDKMPGTQGKAAALPEAESRMMLEDAPIARKENKQDEDLAMARANQQVINAKPAPVTPAKDDAMEMKKTAASETAGAAPGARAKDEVADIKVSSDKMKAKSSDLDPKLSVESYLTQKARLPKAARDNNVSGSVSVQFTIDENGKATNLQVIRGLGFGCDEEALRLIRAFTFEKKAAGRTLTVLAPFVR
jgi:TonB family protein